VLGAVPSGEANCALKGASGCPAASYLRKEFPMTVAVLGSDGSMGCGMARNQDTL